MTQTPSILDVGTATFQREVVERSRQVPVVVDFWAPWCGPCKVLGPLLEKLAREAKGAFVLAKIDTDQNPDLAQAFQITGIPAVLVVNQGKIADGFNGAMPERELRAFLAGILPAAAPDPSAAALALEAAGDRPGAIQELRRVLREQPGSASARIALAGMLLADGKPGEAGLVLEKLDEVARATPAAQAVLAQIALTEKGGGLEAARTAHLADPKDAGARVRYGRALLGARRHEEGLELLLGAVRDDPGFEDGAARKAMLEAFEALGPDHPTTVDFRFRLQMLLMV